MPFRQPTLTLDRRSFFLSTAALAATMSARGFAAPASGRRIDVHHHYLPPQYLKEAPPSADFFRTLDWSPERALSAMDEAGLQVSILSFPTPYLWFSGLEPGRKLARLCNDYSAQLVRDHPRRFGLFAGLPPLDDIEGCLREIEYAAGRLNAHGFTVMSSYGDRWLGDGAFNSIWEELDRRRAVVFVHPSNPHCCSDLKVGVPVGFGEYSFDTARTIMSLWVSNALQRWPRIRFIFSHGGGALPMIADRIDKFGRPGADAKGPRVHDALSQIKTLYFDTGNAANPAALAATRAIADPGHILFGSDYPLIPLARGIEGLAAARLSRRERSAIERENALALMPQLSASFAGPL